MHPRNWIRRARVWGRGRLHREPKPVRPPVASEPAMDRWLSVLQWLPLLLAFAAGVWLSYNSLIYLAHELGFNNREAPAYPFAIDALVVACYVAQWRLAGLPGFGGRRVYVVVLGIVAALGTISGNAVHGVLTWHLWATPLPLPVLLVGSCVPAIAMAGAGHAMTIVRAAERERARIGRPARPQTRHIERRDEPEPRNEPGGASAKLRRITPELVAGAEATVRERGERVTTVAIAKQLGVTPRSVNKARRRWREAA